MEDSEWRGRQGGAWRDNDGFDKKREGLWRGFFYYGEGWYSSQFQRQICPYGALGMMMGMVRDGGIDYYRRMKGIMIA
jgi:hypothetical protein